MRMRASIPIEWNGVRTIISMIQRAGGPYMESLPRQEANVAVKSSMHLSLLDLLVELDNFEIQPRCTMVAKVSLPFI